MLCLFLNDCSVQPDRLPLVSVSRVLEHVFGPFEYVFRLLAGVFRVLEHVSRFFEFAFRMLRMRFSRVLQVA